MNEQELYKRWCDHPLEDDALSQELAGIAGQPQEIYERFYTLLAFGTAGLRGVLGAGTNRMNIYTVRLATQGLAQYLLQNFKSPSVAIAYDSRINSELFARETAGVFAANGIKAWIYRELMPTPALSYAVRSLGCQGGVVITASHNPAKYNGYKAYDETGCQIGEQAADAVLANMQAADIFADVLYKPFEQGLADGSIAYIDEALVQSYIERVLQEQLRPGTAGASGLKLVYTPLNGAGRRCVLEALNRMGLKDITVVPEQEQPDGNFPTCPYPNPEIHQALEKGLALCEKLGADLLLATDPDCDRVGAAVQTPAGPRLISGNEMGVLLLDYICRTRQEQGRMPRNPIAIRTIVTTTMADAVAQAYGVEIKSILTGFKYIGEWLAKLESQGQAERYLLGFEESYGYLTGAYVRDKDAVNASVMICEMAAWYKAQGMSLVDALEQLYNKYGWYKNFVESLAFEGADGMKKMDALMESLRNCPPTELGGCPVICVADYKTGKITGQTSGETGLPASKVLEYSLRGVGSVIVRPSGTEPKLKLYYSIKAETGEQAESLVAALSQATRSLLAAY